MEKNFVIKWLDEIDSTNSEALRHIGELDNLSVIAARNQTAGRGQRGNKWVVEPGANLTFSIVLKFAPGQLKVRDCFCITEAAALAVAGIREAETRIKWPNDIYVNDGKVCGTLIETILSGGLVSTAVAGMGLNMNQTDFDPSLPNPTSMTLLTGQRYDITKELPALLDCIFRYLDQLPSPYARNGFDAEYLTRLYRRGEWRTFEALPASEIPTEKRSGTRFEARILGIDRDARLLLCLSDRKVSVEGLEGLCGRLVGDVGSFIEKVKIFDAGLDDVPLEFCKFVTRQELGKDVDLKFLRTEGADQDIIFTYPEKGQMEMLAVGFNVYEDCCAIVGRNPVITEGLTGLVKVDREWAEQFLG